MSRSSGLDDLVAVEVEFDDPGEAMSERLVRTAKPTPTDPATAAARLMLRTALAATEVKAAVSAAGSVVVVQVPHAAWLDPVIEQWTLLVKDGVEDLDGDVENRRASSKWVSFKRGGGERVGTPDRGNAVIQYALWHNVPVVGFSPSPDTLLPGDLVRAADRKILLQPLTPRILHYVTRVLTGHRCIRPVRDEIAAAVTPSILRLARRPGQSGEDYIERVTRLVQESRKVGRPGPRLEDLKGMPEAVEWGMRALRDIDDFRNGVIRWSDMDRGLLLHGSPGTGKSLYAEAFARSSGLPLVTASFAVWQSAKGGHLGDCLAAMRASFDEARRLAPSILFIDELDALGNRSTCDTGHRDYWSAVVNGFLELMDGPNDRREGVVLMAATNHPEVLDQAILRAGRFDRIIELPLPDLVALEGILQFHGGQDLAGIDLEGISRLAQGMTGADCARVVRGARRTARQAGRLVTEADLLAELDPPEKRSPELLRRIAIHESGHAVAAVVLRPGKLIGATILERGRSGGSVSSSKADQPESVRDGIGDLICQVLAGRAAEQALLSGTVSGGSGGGPGCDLAQATAWALAEETAFGAGGCGLVWSGMPDSSTIAQLLAGRPALEARVSARLDNAYTDTLKLMLRHEVAVRRVATELISRRSLSGAEIEGLVNQHPPLPETTP